MPYKISLLLVGVRNKAQLEGILVMYINIRHKMDRVRAFSSYTLYFLFYSVSREIWGGRARCNIRFCGRSWWIHVKERREKKGGPKRESSNEDAVFKKHPAASAEFHLGKKFKSQVTQTEAPSCTYAFWKKFMTSTKLMSVAEKRSG